MIIIALKLKIQLKYLCSFLITTVFGISEAHKSVSKSSEKCILQTQLLLRFHVSSSQIFRIIQYFGSQYKEMKNKKGVLLLRTSTAHCISDMF